MIGDGLPTREAQPSDFRSARDDRLSPRSDSIPPTSSTSLSAHPSPPPPRMRPFTSSSSSSASPSGLPDRSAREQCWSARDAYFECLTAKGINVPGQEDGACAKQDKAYKKNCAKSWVSARRGEGRGRAGDLPKRGS